MTRRTTIGALAAAASLTGLVPPAHGQNDGGRQPRAAAAKALPCIGCSVDGQTTPRTAAGHPDLNGYWYGRPRVASKSVNSGRVLHRYANGSIVFDFSTKYNDKNGLGRICQSEACQAPNQPPYNDAWMAKVRKIAKTEFGGTTPLDPVQNCRPLGVPRAGIDGITIVQNPKMIAVLYEGAPYSTYRIIYTDGRKHPDADDLESSFFGNSVGHWEGDTLVVDVVGLTTDSWVGGGGATGRYMYTSIHSDKMHVIERWTRKGNVLTYEATVYDPVAFKKPWVITPRRVVHAGPGKEPYENICTPSGEEHYVPPNPNDPDLKTRCGYRCQSDAPGKGAPLQPATVTLTGAWAVTTTFPDGRVATERWTIKQDGNTITASAKGGQGEMPVAGSVEGAFLRVTETDGGRDYKIRASVDGDAMQGSVTLGVGKEYLWAAKRSK